MTVTSSWEGRFRTFSVDAFDVARDRPDRGVVAAGRVEPHQLLAWDRSTGDLRQLTTAAGGIIDGSISADGRWVYYLDDPEATESGRLVRIPWEAGEARLVDRDLAPGFLMHVVSWGSTTAFSIVIGDRCEHRVASSDVDGSRLIATDATFGFVAGFADSGRTLIVARDRADGYRESVFYDVATADEVGRLSAPDCDAFTYLESPIPRDTRYLAETSASGVRRPMIWDRATDARTLLAVDGMDGEIRCIEWAPDGRSVLLLQIEAATMRFYLVDLETGRRRLLPTPSGALTALPLTFSTLFLTPSEVLTIWQDGAHPRSILAIPVDDGEPVIVLGDKDPPPGHPWRSVSFTSTDGTPIQGWLALPACDGPVPAVIDVHGGPGVAQFDEFLPWLQAFVDAGYAVLSINYRSSSTFGEAFLRSIDGHPGELEVEDMAAAADYLVAEGIADPARILAEGWSYGGYLTLMALSRRPDRWAGGICGVGIGDMVAQHAEAASFIGQMFTRVFQGTPDEVPERYVEASPITHAERVVAPLLVIHGRGDIRCPEGQMQRYLDRMAALGKDVSVEWFDAGHLGGIVNPATGIQHTGLMLDFANRVTSKDAPLPIA